MNIILCVFFATLISCKANAENIPQKMHLLTEELVKIIKYTQDESSLNLEKNKESINESIENLSLHIQSIKNDQGIKESGLKIVSDYLLTDLKHAKQQIDQGKFVTANLTIQESLYNCIFCHTRSKSEDFSLPTLDISKLDSLRQANFLFATRQFDKGRVEYEYTVEKFPTPVGHYALNNALIHLLRYYVIIKEDPSAGAAYFKKVSANKNLPDFIKLAAKNWVEDFNNWLNEKKSKSALSNTARLEKVKTLLKPSTSPIVYNNIRDYSVRRFRAQSLLFKILEDKNEKSSIKGEALYYLGYASPSDSPNILFRSMIFKTCINDYPKSDAAKKCYSALERITFEGNFSGQDRLSDQVSKELDELKALAY